MKVYIAQLLCPQQRHCIVACAGEYESDEAAKMLALKLGEMSGAAFGEGLINPWCGICGAKELTVKVTPTRFATMEEAAPFLAASAEAQQRTREFLKAAKN